jgi:cytosine/adenosine deaminase-related metal-dependent hydrolase
MQGLISRYILTIDNTFTIIQNGAIVFDEKIIDVGESEHITQKYPNITFTDLGKNSLIMPSLVNTHIHLEFCKNKTTLTYGSFIDWLKSVIAKRDDLINGCDACIDDSIHQMLKTGTGAFGAISSFGLDLEACVDAKQKVIYFNEVLGSRPDAVDMLYNDFLARLESSKEHQSDRFTPAISIHSPYSTHPILARKAIEKAKESKMPISTHFLESAAEKEWLESGKGRFLEFFEGFMPHAKPMYRVEEYFELFKDTHTLFTHMLYATEQERQAMPKNSYISHCPVSNRLLGGKKLDIHSHFDNVTLGTDGLSSNTSLSLWDEMRNALYTHDQMEPNLLAKELLVSATKRGAEALQLHSGTIEKGKSADLITITLPDQIEERDQLPLMTLIHTKEVDSIYLDGGLIDL